MECPNCGRWVSIKDEKCGNCVHRIDPNISIPVKYPSELSEGMKAVLYILSFIIPIAGLVIGIVILLVKPEPIDKYRHIAKICLILAIIPTLIVIILAFVLYLIVLGIS